MRIEANVDARRWDAWEPDGGEKRLTLEERSPSPKGFWRGQITPRREEDLSFRLIQYRYHSL